MSVTAQVKGIYTIDMEPLEAALAPQSEAFCVHVRAMVGPRGQPGEESFDLKVCSPAWLAAVCDKDGFVFARHHLVVASFQPAEIRNLIAGLVERCSGDSWTEVAQKVARIGYWEFEDYQERSKSR